MKLKIKKRPLIIGSTLLLLALGASYFYLFSKERQVEYELVSPEKKSLSIDIIANGVVEPEDLINVGAQVTGRILSFGKDLNGHEVDYGSEIKAGDTLAIIDSAMYLAELLRSEAQVQQAEAQIAIAETTVSSAEQDFIQAQLQVSQCKYKEEQISAQISQMIAELESNLSKKSLAQTEYAREQNLFSTKVSSKSAYDTAKSSMETATAAVKKTQGSLTELKSMSEESKENTKSAESKLAQSKIQMKQSVANLNYTKASLESSRAELLKASQNMDYCTIISPVDGIVIDRKVNIGQTVVSNMSASTLFLIAKDLQKMQVWVSVNEADIGKIKVGMPANFTVDAFPDSVFHGYVGKVRLNAALSQNVVTFTVELQTDNTDLTLFPYLTATVRFTTQKTNERLVVPIAALNFTPNASLISSEDMHFLTTETFSDRGIVWKLENSRPVPVPVEIEMSDGIYAATVGDLKYEDELITAVLEVENIVKDNTEQSPFLPAKRKNNKRR